MNALIAKKTRNAANTASVRREHRRQGVGPGHCDECGCQLAEWEGALCETCECERDDLNADDPRDFDDYEQ